MKNKIKDTNIVNKIFTILFSSKGRIERDLFTVFYMLLWVLSYIMTIIIELYSHILLLIISLIIYCIYIYILIIISIKRCHDLNNSGWFQLIPIYNPIVLIFFKGDEGENKYGSKKKSNFILQVIGIILFFSIFAFKGVLEDINSNVTNLNTNIEKNYLINNFIDLDNSKLQYKKESNLNNMQLLRSTTDGELILLNSIKLEPNVYNEIISQNDSDTLEAITDSMKKEYSKEKSDNVYSFYETKISYKNGNKLFIINYTIKTEGKIFYNSMIATYVNDTLGKIMLQFFKSKEKLDYDINTILKNLKFGNFTINNS